MPRTIVRNLSLLATALSVRLSMFPIRSFFKFAELSVVIRSAIPVAIHIGLCDVVSAFGVNPGCAHPKMRTVGGWVQALAAETEARGHRIGCACPGRSNVSP